MARRKKTADDAAVIISEDTPDVYMSKYDKISEEKFTELENRIAALESIASPGAEVAISARLDKLEKFKKFALQIKHWFPAKWLDDIGES